MCSRQKNSVRVLLTNVSSGVYQFTLPEQLQKRVSPLSMSFSGPCYVIQTVGVQRSMGV